jgi:L-2-hydroxyglutarate oxidase LhgO
MDRVDAVVVGAGVVGLAIGRALALAGHDVMVLDAAQAIGTGTSSRNSEVIHAGLYYPKNSLKAKLCVAGKSLLYAYAAARGFATRPIGKLIVATQADQVETLRHLQAAGEENGVHDLRLIDATEAKAMEPALACVAALHSPSTGIVDSHAMMLALQGDLEAAGGLVVCHAPVERAERMDQGFILTIGGAEPVELATGILVNAAGHGACALAARINGLDPAHVPRAFLAKGHYFALSGAKAPFSRLIYPVPEAAGLGIHATLDLGGQMKFGPDVAWVEQLDYSPDPERAAGFAQAIRAYWPEMPDDVLQPAYTGIRPKISGPGAPAADFRIDGPARHGMAGLVNLFGIESPGLTASLAIANHVIEALGLGSDTSLGMNRTAA